MAKPTDQMIIHTEQSQQNVQGVIPQDAETTLESIFPMMQHIARWLIHWIYRFCRCLKAYFL